VSADPFADTGLDVSRETYDQLVRFAELLKSWNQRINLVAPSSLPDLWDRHILDSLAVPKASFEPSGLWADLGSGGGFPGVVAAIITPQRRFILVESDQRKATFLRTVRRELNLTYTVEAKRIESLDPMAARTISARALAPLDTLLSLASRHGAPESEYIFPKGETWEKEHLVARESWTYDLDVRSTRGPGKILRITGLQRKS